MDHIRKSLENLQILVAEHAAMSKELRDISDAIPLQDWALGKETRAQAVARLAKQKREASAQVEQSELPARLTATEKERDDALAKLAETGRERDKMAAELGAICVARTIRPGEEFCAVYGPATESVKNILAERDAALSRLAEVEAHVAACFCDYQIEGDESLRGVCERLSRAAETRTRELTECRARLASAERVGARITELETENGQLRVRDSNLTFHDRNVMGVNQDLSKRIAALEAENSNQRAFARAEHVRGQTEMCERAANEADKERQLAEDRGNRDQVAVSKWIAKHIRQLLLVVKYDPLVRCPVCKNGARLSPCACAKKDAESACANCKGSGIVAGAGEYTSEPCPECKKREWARPLPDPLKTLPVDELRKLMNDPEAARGLEEAVKKAKEQQGTAASRTQGTPFEHRCAGLTRADLTAAIDGLREEIVEALADVEDQRRQWYSRNGGTGAISADPWPELPALTDALRKVKALEALEKTRAAERGDSYRSVAAMPEKARTK